ncbi:MAG: hypothetical protein AAF355_16165 [Myxococcota bacterium]
MSVFGLSHRHMRRRVSNRQTLRQGSSTDATDWVTYDGTHASPTGARGQR